MKKIDQATFDARKATARTRESVAKHAQAIVDKWLATAKAGDAVTLEAKDITTKDSFHYNSVRLMFKEKYASKLAVGKWEMLEAGQAIAVDIIAL